MKNTLSFVKMAVLISMILFLTACSDSCSKWRNSILGTWIIETNINGEIVTYRFIFDGERDSGHMYWQTDLDENDLNAGQYEYDGSGVQLRVKLPDYIDLGYKTYFQVYTGDFTSEETMAGTVEEYITADVRKIGQWRATKIDD